MGSGCGNRKGQAKGVRDEKMVIWQLVDIFENDGKAIRVVRREGDSVSWLKIEMARGLYYQFENQSIFLPMLRLGCKKPVSISENFSFSIWIKWLFGYKLLPFINQLNNGSVFSNKVK